MPRLARRARRLALGFPQEDGAVAADARAVAHDEAGLLGERHGVGERLLVDVAAGLGHEQPPALGEARVHLGEEARRGGHLVDHRKGEREIDGLVEAIVSSLRELEQ